jgi:16S rRNA (cytidine1402-2'-O)-methyltransferase
LSAVDVIAAEDTRHSKVLLRHFDIRTPLLALHEHNEKEQAERVVQKLQGGESVALISDAGTPLISDPGYRLVCLARETQVRVVPVPGPSALAAALSVSGLPTDRFVFEGFLPSKSQARSKRLQQLAHETRTLVFYESSHRISESLRDMANELGAEREVVIARELTKLHEQVHQDSLGHVQEWIQEDPNRRKGEFVLVVRGAPQEDPQAQEVDRILQVLLQELPLKQASSLASRITGVSKNTLYKQGILLGKEAG